MPFREVSRHLTDGLTAALLAAPSITHLTCRQCGDAIPRRAWEDHQRQHQQEGAGMSTTSPERSYLMTWDDADTAPAAVTEAEFARNNADDADLIETMERAAIGDSRRFGGGAAPAVTITVFASLAEAQAARAGGPA